MMSLVASDGSLREETRRSDTTNIALHLHFPGTDAVFFYRCPVERLRPVNVALRAVLVGNPDQIEIPDLLLSYENAGRFWS